MKRFFIYGFLMCTATAVHGQENPFIEPPQQVSQQSSPIIPPSPIIERDVLKAELGSTSRPNATDLTIEQLYSLINERDRQYQQRFESQEKAVNNALVAAKEAVNAALAAAKEAVTKAETANEKRLDGVNEFRGQLKDQAATFIPRAEAELKFKSIDSELKRLSDVVLQGTGRFEGAQWLWGILGGLFGGIVTLVGVGLSLRSAFPRKP